jgi:hypothetical protein
MQQACLSLLFIAIIRTIRTISSQNSGYFEQTIYIRLFCKGKSNTLSTTFTIIGVMKGGD